MYLAARLVCLGSITSILVFALTVRSVLSQVTHTPHTEGGQEADEHLHAQIPPPHKQPSEDDVKQAFGEIIDDFIDTNQDQTLDSLELRVWLDANHKRIIDESVDRQWSYYQPTMQEVHSWEGYAVC